MTTKTKGILQIIGYSIALIGAIVSYNYTDINNNLAVVLEGITMVVSAGMILKTALNTWAQAKK